MSASPVRRCIAVASHGRRCQQSPFKGSPYCWHHLQSRKVPAPSRPRAMTPVVTATPDASGLPSIDPVAVAARLAHGLDRATLSALVAFVESPRDGTITLRRDAGEVSVDIGAGARAAAAR